MTTLTTLKQYKIIDLLANSIQPFPDMSQEDLEDLARGLKGPRALERDPVKLTADGRLFDGNQRLKALLLNGRVHISASEVRIYEDVKTEDDAWFWSGRFNSGRRHLTQEQRMAVALKYRAERHWSDAKIADAMSVTKMTIGRWLKSEEKLDAVVGKDGVIQPQTGKVGGREGRSALVDKPWINPWQSDGPVLRMVVKLERDLTAMIPDGDGHSDLVLPKKSDLGDRQFDFCKLGLEDLLQAVTSVLAEMARPDVPAKPKAPVSKRPARPPRAKATPE